MADDIENKMATLILMKECEAETVLTTKKSHAEKLK